MFGVGHHRDVAPLDGEPVGQGEQGDGGGVGPRGVELKHLKEVHARRNRRICGED